MQRLPPRGLPVINEETFEETHHLTEFGPFSFCDSPVASVAHGVELTLLPSPESTCKWRV